MTVDQALKRRLERLEELKLMLDREELTPRHDGLFAEQLDPGSRVGSEEGQLTWVRSSKKTQPLPQFRKSMDTLLQHLPLGWTRCVDASSPGKGVQVDLFAPGTRPERVSVTHQSEHTALMIAILEAVQIDLVRG